MQIHIQTIMPGDAAAQEELNRFLRGHRVLTIDRQWTGSAWTFCIAWQEPQESAFGLSAPGGRSGERIDYKEKLPPEAFARFSRMREVRKKLAEQTAMPLYAVFTNDHLAAFAQLRSPVTATDLEKIDGINKARLEKFGAPILEALQNVEIETDKQATPAPKQALGNNETGRGGSILLPSVLEHTKQHPETTKQEEPRINCHLFSHKRTQRNTEEFKLWARLKKHLNIMLSL
jgi:hypothetical protein